MLTLNPDVLLLPNFIQALVDAGQFDPKIGTVCGKLLTMTRHFEIPEKPVVDSTGIYFTPMLRHLDRGSQEVDNGHYLKYEYVFGATAAAALYRRAMIDDISLDGEFFDSDFFVYREDADVAWRAQLMGWRCLYAPYARGYHVRKVLPGNRRALPPEINMHSVKNRFLMRIKNMSPDLYRRNWFSITARDLVVVMCCLLWEHTFAEGVLVSGQELAAACWPSAGGFRPAPRWTTSTWPAGSTTQPVSKPGAARSMARVLFAVAKPPRRKHAESPMRIAHPRHARHSGQLRRLRNLRRRTLHPAGGARSPGHGLLPRAASRADVSRRRVCNTCPPSGTSISTPSRTPSSPRCTCSSHRADVALYCNGANAIFTLLPRLFGMPVALNVDGIERKRKKWNRAGAGPGIWSRNGWPRSVPTWWSPMRRPFRTTTASATARQRVFIPYGAESARWPTTDVLGAAGPGARRILPLREPHGAGEQSAAGARGVRAGESPT